MPLTASRFGVSLVLVLIFIFGAFAQSAAPTSADVMRERITKAKALMAVKNYNAAIYEMEGIRRETNDATVNSVVQVMLMGCYIEQADYKRAQSLLDELYAAQKANKPNANYYVVAAQIVKGARSQLSRYNSLGLSVSDRNLPLDAVNDITRMRETVEAVITQSRELSGDKKQSSDALALLEEAINARSGLATDDYDSKRWKNEIADVRENMMNSRSIVNAVDDSGVQNASTLALNTSSNAAQTTTSSASIIPVSNPAGGPNNNSSVANKPKTETPKVETPKTETPRQNETSNQATAKTESLKAPEKSAETKTDEKKDTAALKPNVNNTAANTPTAPPPTRSRRVPGKETQAATNAPQTSGSSENKAEPTAATTAKDDSPLSVGSLLEYATERIDPTYPPAAKTMRMTGTVRVELVVDEEGKVEVENTTGPSMLQRAALDALKKWRFKPFTRDGQPVKAKGFVSFSFNL